MVPPCLQWWVSCASLFQVVDASEWCLCLEIKVCSVIGPGHTTQGSLNTFNGHGVFSVFWVRIWLSMSTTYDYNSFVSYDYNSFVFLGWIWNKTKQKIYLQKNQKITSLDYVHSISSSIIVIVSIDSNTQIKLKSGWSSLLQLRHSLCLNVCKFFTMPSQACCYKLSLSRNTTLVALHRVKDHLTGLFTLLCGAIEYWIYLQW